MYTMQVSELLGGLRAGSGPLARLAQDLSLGKPIQTLLCELKAFLGLVWCGVEKDPTEHVNNLFGPIKRFWDNSSRDELSDLFWASERRPVTMLSWARQQA